MGQRSDPESAAVAAEVAVMALRVAARDTLASDDWLLLPSKRTLSRAEFAAALAGVPKPTRCSAAATVDGTEVICEPQSPTADYRLSREAALDNLRRLREAHPAAASMKLLVRSRYDSLLVSEAAYTLWRTDYYIRIVERILFPHADADAVGAQALVELYSAEGLEGELKASKAARKRT